VKQPFNFLEVISSLKESELISRVEIKTIDEIHESGIYKVRCSLIPSKYKLEIRFVKTQEQILYAARFNKITKRLVFSSCLCVFVAKI